MHHDSDGSARRVAAGTADLVSHLADRVRSIADTIGTGESGFSDLAAAAGALAGQANTAAQEIDGCLARARRHSDPGTSTNLAIAEHGLVLKWTTTLESALDAVIAIYAQVLAKLADHASVAEELLTIAPAAERPLLSAAVLAAHARAWFASESMTQIGVLITHHLRGFRHDQEGVFDDRAGTFAGQQRGSST
jgi:hypothetical protein